MKASRPLAGSVPMGFEPVRGRTIPRSELNFRAISSDQLQDAFSKKVAHMLAEKFFLLLETLRSQSQSYPDGSPIIVSTTRHVPVKLPNANTE
jgi:hypothetical protein